MERVVKKVSKKEFLAAVVVIGFVAVYLACFKPIPAVKVDWNKFQVGKKPAALTLETPTAIPGVGKHFTVEVKLDTNHYIVNAVQSYIKFDPSVIEVVNADTQDSFCKFYPENNYSNAKGVVKLACGAPYPGFKGVNSVQKIEFLTKTFATTQISLQKESQVLANDGKGTNILKGLDSKEITIKAAL